jgi:hypothetical protein
MPSLNESFLSLIRQVLKEPAMSLEQALKNPLAQALMETVQGSLARTAESNAAEEATKTAPRAMSSSLPSKVLIHAAIEDTFDMAELQPDDMERAKLLELSDLVTIEGKRRLRLTDAARAEILAAGWESESYRSLLREAKVNDSRDHKAIGKDPIRLTSAWMRCFLSGDFGDLEAAPPQELKAALGARERLRLVAQLPAKVPPIPDLASRVGLAELLEPLRVLIGAEGGWDGTPRVDHFVGRIEELRQLREFVGELSSHSAGESITRFANRATSALTGRERPGLMIIEADGGLGKSALVAKFLLDHVLDQSRRFPFAYLDFDRATLDPERPQQILLEITRQVGLQYPEARSAFSELVNDIRTELAGPPAEGPSTKATIRDPFTRFVETLQEHATFRRRAFLLVLDTLEVVQWSPKAIEHLSRLIEQFRRKGLDELRVVACGRADIPEFRRARGGQSLTVDCKLKPLQSKEAREMAEKLGRRGLGDAWKAAWSEAIATGKSKSSAMDTLFGWIGASDNIRREPLSVRVAVDFVVRTKDPDRQGVVDDIANAGSNPGEDFVARLYENRIQNHIRNGDAGRLAWPGLVIRRLTDEIVRDVLAELCGMSSDAAAAAFSALGQEIWMVDREDGALKHRVDLRARTLPLMKRKDPVAFAKVAQAAVAYFGAHRERSGEDRLEWLYHRFLAGESPETIEHEITPEMLAKLARAERDFEPGSLAASYIASRTATGRLAPSRIRQLRPMDALFHLRTVAQSVFGLDDPSLDRVALEVSDQLDPEPTGDLLPWARALWIKSGAWQRLERPFFRKEGLTGPLLRAELFWMARIAASLDQETLEKYLAECSFALKLQSEEGEHSGFRAMVHAMALARLADSPTYDEFDAQISAMCGSMKSNPAPSTQAALRAAVIFGDSCRSHALDLWLQARRRGSSERVQNPTLSLSELHTLSRMLPEVRELFSQIPDEDLVLPMRFTDETILSSFGRALEEMSGSIANGDTGMGTALAAVFASRQEDWIIPFGYAADLATKGRIPPKAMQRLAGYSPYWREESNVDPAAKPSDMLATMRTADEAGDLAEMVRLILANCEDTPASASLSQLMHYHVQWTGAIGKLVASAPLNPQAQFVPPELEDQPPAPGPISHKDDPQKGRWGGLAERDGRLVRPVLESVERDIYYFSLIVESTDSTELRSPVIFHLHDTFPRSVISIRRIIGGTRAELSEWSAFGVFAVGVQVRNARGQWIALELDLAKLPGLPKRFLAR